MIAIETLREEASQLSVEERAAFASFVIRTLPPPDDGVSDEEVVRRHTELTSGAEVGLSTDELFKEVAARLR